MKKLIYLITVSLFTLSASESYGVDLERVVVNDVSSTKLTIAVNRGTLDEAKVGQWGKFFVQVGNYQNPKIFLVAEGELVKAFPKESYWYLKTVHLPEALKKGSSYLFFANENVFPGREDNIRLKKVVYSDTTYDSLDEFIEDSATNVPKRFQKQSDEYVATNEIVERDKSKLLEDETAKVRSYETFRNSTGQRKSDVYNDLASQKFFVDKVRVQLGDIKKAEDKKLYESMGKGYQKQVNDRKYAVQSRIDEMGEFNQRLTSDSVYEKYLNEKKEKNIIEPRALAKMERDGKMWSADMDDKTLRSYFVQTGLESEVRRRELALNELDGHEITLRYSGGMISHANSEDPNYHSSGYSLTLGYDLHLSRVSANLKNWSALFFVEMGIVDYDTGKYNARSDEMAYGGYLNYYFHNNPLTLNRFIHSAGIGIKAGTAKVFAPNFSKEYNYQLLSMPSLQYMMKYRFRTGELREDTANIGASLNLGVQYEMKKLSVIDSVEDEISSQLSINDLKYVLGFSVFF